DGVQAPGVATKKLGTFTTPAGADGAGWDEALWSGMNDVPELGSIGELFHERIRGLITDQDGQHGTPSSGEELSGTGRPPAGADHGGSGASLADEHGPWEPREERPLVVPLSGAQSRAARPRARDRPTVDGHVSPINRRATLSGTVSSWPSALGRLAG